MGSSGSIYVQGSEPGGDTGGGDDDIVGEAPDEDEEGDETDAPPLPAIQLDLANALRIAQDFDFPGGPTGDGELDLFDGARVRAHTVLVGAAGVVRGEGEIIAIAGMHANGLVQPGVSIERQIATPGDDPPTSKRTKAIGPGALTITGDLTLEPGARAEMRVFGPGAGQSDRLELLKHVDAGGTLDIRFENGYLPRRATGLHRSRHWAAWWAISRPSASPTSTPRFSLRPPPRARPAIGPERRAPAGAEGEGEGERRRGWPAPRRARRLSAWKTGRRSVSGWGTGSPRSWASSRCLAHIGTSGEVLPERV